jgi:hypothetical protein
MRLLPPVLPRFRRQGRHSEIIDLSGANVSSTGADETILSYDETIFRFLADNRKQR